MPSSPESLQIRFVIQLVNQMKQFVWDPPNQDIADKLAQPLGGMGSISSLHIILTMGIRLWSMTTRLGLLLLGFSDC